MIRIGTAGWSYSSGQGRWTNIFYPSSRVDQLEFYARFFTTVEINNSFYRPLAPDIARGWATKTRSDFRFCVKLFQKFTHPAMFEQGTGQDPGIQPADFDDFEAGIAPLAEAGKLGVLLAQFPPSFKLNDFALDQISQLAARFGRYGLVAELRHRSWTDDPGPAAQFDRLGLSWVHIDEPRFPSSVGQAPNVGKLAYFRFHGRNARDWWRGDREARYNYLYSIAQQAELAQQIVAVAGRAGDTYVLYNNHFGGKAVANALQMRLLLGQEIEAEVPAPLREAYPELAELLTRESVERGEAT